MMSEGLREDLVPQVDTVMTTTTRHQETKADSEIRILVMVKTKSRMETKEAMTVTPHLQETMDSKAKTVEILRYNPDDPIPQ